MADFPTTIYSPRTIANKAGVIYDPDIETTLFAEDIQKADDEIVAIETILGANPQGGSDTVGERIEALEGGGLGATKIVFPVLLSGAKFVNIQAPNLATGDNDLYTVPANKKAFFLPNTSNINVYNNSGVGNILCFLQIKVSGNYHRISGATLTVANTNASAISCGAILLNAGESISINTATNNGLSVIGCVLEFDDTVPIVSGRVLDLANGNNTIYTCPVGKTAIPLQSFLAMRPILAFINNSGGSRTVSWHQVQSGQAVANGYIISTGGAIGSPAISGASGVGALSAGDFYNITTNSGTAGQLAHITMVEI